MKTRCPFSTRLYLSHKTSFVRPFPLSSVVTVGFSAVSATPLETSGSLLVQRLESLKGDTRTYNTSENTTTNTHGRPALFRFVQVTSARGSMESSAFECTLFRATRGSFVFEFMTRTFRRSRCLVFATRKVQCYERNRVLQWTEIVGCEVLLLVASTSMYVTAPSSKSAPRRDRHWFTNKSHALSTQSVQYTKKCQINGLLHSTRQGTAGKGTLANLYRRRPT